MSALFFLIVGVSHVWALPNCVGPWNALTWDNCLGTYMWDGGDKYVGNFKNGKKHGQGTYTNANGDKHVGEYNNGKRHGQGTYTFAD